jgi:hypothetical protein
MTRQTVALADLDDVENKTLEALDACKVPFDQLKSDSSCVEVSF